MDIVKAKTLAMGLIELHLSDVKYDWKFEFSNAKRIFGVCAYGHKYGKPYHRIKLSKILTSLNSEEKVKDTILHEIAHALDVEERGYSNHDTNWNRIARSIGCDGERCYNSMEINQPKSKYSLMCMSCKKETSVHRRPKRKKACGVCCKEYNYGKYSEDYVLILRNNG